MFDKILRLIFIALSLFCAIVIFSFSAQTGEKSSHISGKVTKVAVGIINVGKERIDPNPTSEAFQSFGMFIRKLAHFSIYCALSFFVYGFCNTFTFSSSKKLIFTMLFCFLYACSDELHQSFVSGRAPMLTDVMIDTAGAFLGALCFDALAFLIVKIKAKKGLRQT